MLSHFTLSRHYDATSAKPSAPYEGIFTRVPRRCFLGRLRDKGSVAQCALLEAHRATEQGHSPKLAPRLLGWHHALCSYRNAGTGEKAMMMRRVAQVERSSSGTQVAFGRSGLRAS